jgi:AcrR family transcriptional regulator
MADQSGETVATQAVEIDRRVERANRILDAAATLILRWGYNKTTIDDIARQAGVAKGTIYLHWKTREDLFAALVKREQVALGHDFRQYLATDPQGVTLRGIFKYTALALLQRPLLKAFLTRDMDVLGKMAQREQGSEAYAARLGGFQVYLEFLRQHGLIRTDLNVKDQLFMVSAIFTGYFLTVPLMPAEMAPTDTELADQLAETIHCTLESHRAVSDDELRAINQAFMAYLTPIETLTEDQLQGELGKRDNDNA